MKFANVFSNKMGKFKGKAIKIQFDEQAKHVVQPRWKIPLHYMERLGKELKRRVALLAIW